MTYAIQTRSKAHDWTDDPGFLGWGCVKNDNRWDTEAEALAACDELADVWGCPRTDLRVVSVNA